MTQERKRLLIVDDMEIDRLILKSILCKEFEIMEASDGNTAFEYITKKKDELDAILLDLSMPHIDGFDILTFMKDKGLDDIPVFLVTAEPTRENVEKAVRFNIAEFVGKPFDRDDILRRLRSRLGLNPVYARENCDMNETMKYINDLQAVYQTYLNNFNKSDARYRVMVDLMTILLNSYRQTVQSAELNDETIRLISKAAYFCDIGEMLIPDKGAQFLLKKAPPPGIEKTHTEQGAALIRLNRSKGCSYFVEVCSSMCLHHHERYDGEGYPSKLKGKNNSIFNQLCRLVDEFEQMRSKFYDDKAKPVSFVVRRLINDDGGMVSPELYALLEDSEKLIFNYFMKKGI